MTPLLRSLLEMLTYCRPNGSTTERDFIALYLKPLGAQLDGNKNYHVRIPKPDGSASRVLWSCHTDTVARASGRQTLHFDAATGIVGLSRKSQVMGRNCLGADDTAGVWLCVNMILAGVPGHYVFHYGEECGGLGSSALAQYDASQLDGIDCAIALDRRGDSDIITRQQWSRCASDTFADSLALELFRASDERLIYSTSDGSYTDTAEYVGIVPECTNLSVGYDHEHSPFETLDTDHCVRLLGALLAFNESNLEIEREPTNEPDWADWSYREVDSPPLLDDDGRPITWDDDPQAVDCYLDRVARDVQRALKRSNCPTCGRDTFEGFDHVCVPQQSRYPRKVD